MRFRLDLTLRPAEGALLRVLGTAERRGYTPLAIEGQRSNDGSAWNLALTLEGERAAEGLCRQMEKLYDCLKVEVAECP
ncbi:ACT domain-containing protein [uncultured Aquimonas sp.]|jgi:acetolactate synthase II small subunit|uniref:ACT domain-containing protein n=1 Tax=uncultured Aquimonas sp. TaxID=385483 RepID=UPI00086EB415|nr:ACT domain-containing protein [uncultured Aquimonas sp.]ODU41450.1 MAG: acetolactate synthase [Xanthomonadaceae bacterium SCN 69-123]